MLEDAPSTPVDSVTVACYTFPHWHGCRFNDCIYGPGWTEYVLMEGARPWYPGHRQPRQPLLGKLDEREPATWERYNDIAAQHGIDVFIWDSYWFNNGPALNEALDEGFLYAANNKAMKFAAMWTNHHWPMFFPTVNEEDRNNLLLVYEGPVKSEVVWRSMTYLIVRYLHYPNYWRIDDLPVFVVWNVPLLLREFGDQGTKDLLDELRKFARRLGHKGIHFHATGQSRSVFEKLDKLGFDSYGRYSALPEAAVRLNYEEQLPQYADCVHETVKNIYPENIVQSPLPFFPAVNPGWDTSPRRCGPPYPPPGIDDGDTMWPAIIENESPRFFELFTRNVLSFVRKHQLEPAVMTIGCWNEWTEGQYLLPDNVHGFGMIRALAKALGREGFPKGLGVDQLLG